MEKLTPEQIKVISFIKECEYVKTRITFKELSEKFNPKLIKDMFASDILLSSEIKKKTRWNTVKIHEKKIQEIEINLATQPTTKNFKVLNLSKKLNLTDRQIKSIAELPTQKGIK